MRNFIWIACMIYGINGFGHIILGTILEPLVGHYEIAYSDSGQLLMNQFLGFLIGVLIAPAIVKYLGRKMVVIIALLLFAFSQVVLGILPSWGFILYTIPLGGAFLPKIAGMLIDHFDISVMLWSLVLCAFILLCLMGVIFYFRNRVVHSPEPYKS